MEGTMMGVFDGDHVVPEQGPSPPYVVRCVVPDGHATWAETEVRVNRLHAAEVLTEFGWGVTRDGRWHCPRHWTARNKAIAEMFSITSLRHDEGQGP